MVGQGFSLDGAGDFVRVVDAPALNPTGSFTIEAWIFPTRDDGPIAQKWGDQGDWSCRRSYGLNILGEGVLLFAISDDAHQQDEPFHAHHSNPDAAPLDAWTHVAFVYDQATGTRRMFANGVMVGERTDLPITLTNASADLAFGAHIRSSTNLGSFYRGVIDEVQLFDRAVSADEVEAAYAAGAAGTCR